MLYLLPAFFISLFGIFNLFGITSSLFINQLLNVIIGIIAFFVIKKIGPLFLRRNSYLFFWSFIIILIITHLIGFEAKGAKRWISFYFVNFQPSEFLKVFYILYLADFFSKNYKNFDNLIIFLKSIVYFLIPFILIYKQPDLGTALIFAFIYFIFILFAKIPKRYLIYLLLIFIASMPLNWFFLKDYQKARIMSFVNPKVDQKGTSYNMIQAVITVGSGEFFGRGLGQGTQSRLLFLPENHTDFAFSSLVEQFGFLGGFIVLLLYTTLIMFIVRRLIFFSNHYNNEDKRFNFFVIIGVLSLFIFQIFVNMGMNLGIVPVAGISLPFISYGGSAVIAFFMSLALIP